MEWEYRSAHDLGELQRSLRAAGLWTRISNAITYSTDIRSIEELNTLPWGDGSPGSGLWWILRTTPKLGPRSIAEILAFRNAD